MRRALLAPAAVLLAAVGSAQSIDVAIVAAASSSTSDCRFTDPQMLLMATGLFASVGVINAGQVTPTINDLTQYDAVITWSNIGYADSAAFGDVLADYVDLGGGVVVTTFANASNSTTLSIQGRWQGAYEVIEDRSGQTTGPASLGVVHDPAHPIMAGVSTFSGGTNSYRPTVTTLVMGASSIAEWDDGRVLVAAGPLASRVDLGFYPPSSLCRSDFWDSTTDGDLLMANALIFAAQGGSGLGTNYCVAAANSTGAGASMVALGSSWTVLNDVTLGVNHLPQGSFAFFITSQVQALVSNPGGSQGPCAWAVRSGASSGPVRSNRPGPRARSAS